MGAFIVFEGGEGSGKSTQAKIMYRSLLFRGHPALLTHEPGGTVLGERVRRMVKGHGEVTPLAWLFLFSAARAQLVQEVIRPALADEITVVCDRYTSSTIAYQGYGHGLDMSAVHAATEAATEGLQPDLVVLLDGPPSLGLERKGTEKRDRFEAEALEFHERVRRGYLELAGAEPERWLVVDAGLSREQAAETIWERVEPLLKGPG